jgi:septation ring formation regulator EzrA
MNQTMTNGYKPSAEPNGIMFKQYSDGVLDLFAQVCSLAAEESETLQPLLLQTLDEVEHLRHALQVEIERLHGVPVLTTAPAVSSDGMALLRADIDQLRQAMLAAQQKQQEQTEATLSVLSQMAGAISTMRTELNVAQAKEADFQTSLQQIRDQLGTGQVLAGFRSGMDEIAQIAAAGREHNDRLNNTLHYLSSLIETPHAPSGQE